MIALVLIIAALIVFVLACFPIPSRVNLIALGLALLTAAILIDRFLPLVR
jgi:hypothetical protein